MGIELARIEGNEIVIRVPIDAIAHAAEGGWASGAIPIRLVVTDPQKAAKSMLQMLRRESENGTTQIDRLLDWALVEAMEQGEEGIDIHEDQAP